MCNWLKSKMGKVQNWPAINFLFVNQLKKKKKKDAIASNITKHGLFTNTNIVYLLEQNSFM